MRAVIDLISRVRNIRSELKLKPGEAFSCIIGAPDEKLQELFAIEKTASDRAAGARR